MIYYNVVSCVSKYYREYQSYKYRKNAIKAALKSVDSDCYNKVYIWIANTDNPVENKIMWEWNRKEV